MVPVILNEVKNLFLISKCKRFFVTLRMTEQKK